MFIHPGILSTDLSIHRICRRSGAKGAWLSVPTFLARSSVLELGIYVFPALEVER